MNCLLYLELIMGVERQLGQCIFYFLFVLNFYHVAFVTQYFIYIYIYRERERFSQHFCGPHVLMNQHGVQLTPGHRLTLNGAFLISGPLCGPSSPVAANFDNGVLIIIFNQNHIYITIKLSKNPKPDRDLVNQNLICKPKSWNGIELSI